VRYSRARPIANPPLAHFMHTDVHFCSRAY
jgi:hypothetical protein